MEVNEFLTEVAKIIGKNNFADFSIQETADLSALFYDIIEAAKDAQREADEESFEEEVDTAYSSGYEDGYEEGTYEAHIEGNR